MKRIEMLQIKHSCIKYCIFLDLTLDFVNDVEIRAHGVDCELHVPFQHVYDLVTMGWDLNEVLTNEMNYREVV